jgi:hypothetical protein
MAGFKTPDFNERTAAAKAAKQAALDQLRNKAAPDPAVVAARQAAAAAREAAAAERREARKLAAEEAEAAKPVAAEVAPAIPKPTEEELKAARDAKYAARKSRQR